jgi:hypothetical protein
VPEATWILTGSSDNLRATREHVRKWPAEHWRLAFHGQLRTVSAADGELIERRLRGAAGSRSPA